MFEFFLALRYLRSRRRRRLTRLSVAAAVVGVAAGVAALVVALALANGFRDEVRDKILRGTAHVTAARRGGQLLTDWRADAARLRGVAGVSSVSATTYDGALLIVDGGAAVLSPPAAYYAVLRGIDVDDADAVAELRRVTVAGDASRLASSGGGADEDDEIFVTLGANLAERARLRVGAYASILTANAALGEIGDASAEEKTKEDRRRRVRVGGIFRTGLYEYDATWIYVSLPGAARLTGAPLAASALSVGVADPDRVGEVAARVGERLGEQFSVVDWREANRPLFAALTLERRVILAIIALIVGVAALNITTSLSLLVNERRGDIAILVALGARPASVTLIFLLEGAIIGAIGAASGVALAALAAYLGNRYQLISLPADVYSISAVPFHIEWREAITAALAAFALSVAATIYPARLAARVRPAEALRDK